jgi:ribulose-5-phosphate 4-epimerase/fuculose-1-phosphate aldolase
VRDKAKKHHAVLLANHGPVVAGKSLEDAVYNAEELEETAKLYLLLEGRRTRYLDTVQIADLEKHFPS